MVSLVNGESLALRQTGINSANSAFVIPAGYFIDSIFVRNTTANAVTGGLKFGTSSGATDIVAALTTGANALMHITDAAILKRIFSVSATQTVFIDAVVAWNSASVDITIFISPL